VTLNKINGQNTNNAGSYDIFVAKYDQSGQRSWSVQKGSNGIDYLGGIVTTSDGVYVVGSSQGTNQWTDTPAKSHSHGFLCKYSLDGATLHYSRTYGSAWAEFYGITADSDGNVFVVGTASAQEASTMALGTTGGGLDVWVMKVNPTNGDLVWQAQLNSPNNGEDKGQQVEVRGSELYVSGITAGDLGDVGGAASGKRLFVLRLDVSTGALI